MVGGRWLKLACPSGKVDIIGRWENVLCMSNSNAWT